MTLYDRTKMTGLEHTTTVWRSITSKNRHEMVAPWFAEASLKLTAENMRKHIVWFEANCNHAWKLPYFFGAARTYIFKHYSSPK